jgi:hypothetical protein
LLCCRSRWRSLGEVRAAEAYDEDRMRSNIELATWTRRLAHELGGFAPADVALPAVPENSPAHLRSARDGFRLLVALRWADGPHRPVAWSVRFASAWCDLTFRQAREANYGLQERGVIRPAGRIGRARLFLPGRAALTLVDTSSAADLARAERFANDYPELTS